MKRFPGRIVAPLLFASLISTFAAGCKAPSSSVTTAHPDQPSTQMEETYTELKPGKSIIDYDGKNIWVVGKQSNLIMQHMMKGSMNGIEQHFYLDYNGGSQVVAYHKGLNIPDDGKEHKFYGKVGSMKGPGKNSKAGYHTEFYLDVHKVE